MARTLHDSNEIIMYQGDKYTATVAPKDAKGNAIAVSGTVTGLKFEAFKYIDDTTPSVTVASVTEDNTNILVNFVQAETATATPLTYTYYITATVDGSIRTLAKNHLTILRCDK